MLRFLRGVAAVTVLLFLWRASSVGSPAGGQSGAPSPDQRQHTLSGTVVNSVTGDPIRRARVELNGASAGVALTDDNGQFHFDGLTRGSYQVSVRKPGFFDQRELDSNPPGFAPSASVGPDSPPMTLKLVPQAVIYGRIESAQREPIENLAVHLIARRIVEGRIRWEEVQGAATNDEGEFRMANLVPGSYYLEFGPGPGNNYLKQLAGHGEGYPMSFYPGVSELSAATPVELGPGQQWNADVSLKSTPLLKVSGTIVGVPPDGNAGLEFIDQLGGDVLAPTEFDSARGEFRSALPAGSYTLVANAWSESQGQREAVAPLNLTSDVVGMQLVLTDVRSVPIVITTESVRPTVGRSTLARAAASISVHLVSAGELAQRADFWTAPEGEPKQLRLSFGYLRPGKYAVEVKANDPWYVQSARSGDVDLLNEDLTVTGAFTIAPIEVLLRDDGASIHGQVRLQPNQPKVAVLLVPEHGSSVHPKSILVNDDGSFLVSTLAPGNYDVLALDHIEGLEYANPAVLDRYLAQGVHLTLNPGEHRRITVDPIKTGN